MRGIPFALPLLVLTTPAGRVFPPLTFPSIQKTVDARDVKALVMNELKCNFSQMFLLLARLVRGGALKMKFCRFG